VGSEHPGRENIPPESLLQRASVERRPRVSEAPVDDRAVTGEPFLDAILRESRRTTRIVRRQDSYPAVVHTRFRNDAYRRAGTLASSVDAMSISSEVDRDPLDIHGPYVAWYAPATAGKTA
jgi:hypothetical protein